MADKKTYIVGNPYDLPKGTPMISWQEYTWFEGESFQAPDGLKIQRLIDQAYLLAPNTIPEESVDEPEGETE